MQEYRDDEVVKSELLPEDAPTLMDKLSESIKKMANGEIDHVRIGRFPEINEGIEINGIRFVVIDHPNEGQFTATISEPRVPGASNKLDGE